MKRLLLILTAIPLLAVKTFTSGASGCDQTTLSAALTDAATWQDSTTCEMVIVELTAGEVYSGTFTFPDKACEKYVVIRSNKFREFSHGTRVTPADVALMPTIRTPSTVAAITINSSYWRMEGIEVDKATTGGAADFLIRLSDSVTTTQLTQLPHHVQFHRCYIHGSTSNQENKRGISMNALNVEIMDSDFRNFLKPGEDSQALFCRSACISFYATNNMISASTENFLAGGSATGGLSDTTIGQHPQSGIWLRGNYFWKDPRWKRSTSAGPCAAVGGIVGELCRDTVANQWYELTALPSTWTMVAAPSDLLKGFEKNLFELKDGRRVFLIGNVLENSWPDGQVGQWTIINATGQRVYSYSVQDVVHAYNHIKSAATGAGLANLINTWASTHPTLPPSITHSDRISWVNNLNTGIWGSAGRSAEIGLAGNFTFRHNSMSGVTNRGISASSDFMQFFYSWQQNQQFVDNIWSAAIGSAGLVALNSRPGQAWCGLRNAPVNSPNGGSLDFRAQAYVGGTTIGTTCTGTGGTNGPTLYTGTLPATEADIYVDPTSDWTVKPGSPALNAATDGTNIGADIDMVNGATSTVTAGTLSNWHYFQIRGIRPSSTGATVYYTAPTQSACTTTVSVSETFSSTTGTIGSTTAVGLSRQLSVTDLTAKTPYWLRVVCGTYQYRVPFMTWS